MIKTALNSFKIMHMTKMRFIMSGDLIRQINFRIKCETQSPRLRAVGTSDKKVLQSCLGGPMTRNLVVDKLSERRFEAIQEETSI